MKLLARTELIAFDRGTVRHRDEDGRLHVSKSNISKANICPYRGVEIPGWQQLGLDAHKTYNLLRDPEELAKGAHTFNNLPILREHVHVTADAHRPELVVGSTGTHAAFDGEHLHNALVVWDSEAIQGVERNAARELSSAYHYDADMTPGVFNGQAYDGIMRNIRGNHVALVPKGRAGNTVIVGDAMPSGLQRARIYGAYTTKFKREPV